MDITITTSITPAFGSIGPLCQNGTAPALPSTSTNGITGTWNPATISTASVGTTTYTFTPDAGQCATPVTMDITITTSITPTFGSIGPLCQNGTAPALPTTSTNGITGTWSPATISTTTAGNTTYTFTADAGQCATAVTVDITITGSITPTFNSIGPLELNSIAPALPTSSSNIPAITGTWSPATINTLAVATTTYTFTPDSGQCAVIITMDISVPDIITPTFTAIGPLCQNSIPQVLPTSSTNVPAITGTWNPATISTATVGTTTYTFTPDSEQNASATTLVITTTPQITPTFNPIGPLNINSDPPTLPTRSTNSPTITGKWTPARISTANIQITTYTFTPDSGQCALKATLTISITSSIAPVFAAIGPLCQNSSAPVLPLSSTNGITGTWSPATINTASPGTTTYQFTPDNGQNATAMSMNITITGNIAPLFAPIGPLDFNSSAPVLSSTSTNGITGAWSPATINTAVVATTTYTFTPDSGQCALSSSMDIAITSSITPVFAAIGPLCQNSTPPALPTTSSNGITGTWSPATINTAAVATTTYTFTPDGGQGATVTTLDITITGLVTPIFTAIGPLCQNSAAPILPVSSTNTPAITGSWSPVTINTAVVATTAYTFTPTAGQCANAVTMNITITNSLTPTFAAIGPLCQNSIAPTLTTSSTNTPAITGTWSPATINTAVVTTTAYKFTPVAGQCASTTTLSVVIVNQITPTFSQIGPLCQNSAAPALPLISTNIPAITGTWSPATINTAVVGTTIYTFTPTAGQCGRTTTMSITTTGQTVPAFTAIGPLCQNSTAPALPTRSTNGITGTWNPVRISTTTVGTRTYIFTPGAGQCATITTLAVAITARTTPAFAAVGPICQNSSAPALPLTSTNGITGTWSPATISTTTAGTRTYTFTPGAGQCATNTTLRVTINAQTAPAFMAIGPLCLNSTAPGLPLTSTNGITGTWSPVAINTASVATDVYTFTPNAGQCATTATMKIAIASQIIPTFTQIGPLCQNSVPVTLPVSSTNGITGTWSPATITTAIVGTNAYRFTPTAGQCATTAVINITITPKVTPTFTQIGPLCQNSTTPVLPSTSTNGVIGTWSPALISTAIGTTTIYTFTPGAGQCATGTTMSITINPLISPTFTQIGSLCLNSSAPALPTSSTNMPAITGTWSPVTISTALVGTATYTFTPDAGQCATTATMKITTASQINPTFTPIGPLCQNSTAPLLSSTSINGITGTWSPAAINTTTVATASYTFTPDAGQCAVGTSINVTINAQITPTFGSIGPLCLNGLAPTLPVSSTNAPAITGTWNLATISTAAVGTTIYTFTPATGECATRAILGVTVASPIVPTFTQIGTLCQNAIAPVLPASSTNGIIGTWSPAAISTGAVATTTYTFTPATGQCANSASMDIKIVPQITPSFIQIGSLCQNSAPPILPVSSINGISGTWNPTTISTAAVATTAYTFTPDAGQCATIATMIVTVNAPVTPLFVAIGPICQNSTAPVLPLSSINGISGTWAPATINTALAGTSKYIFTPATGTCANNVSMSITITPQVIPAFEAIGPLCQNSLAPVLPFSSINTPVLTGMWSPSTISTAVVATTTYTFTPNVGQCAAKISVDISINPQITPTFTGISPICQNSSAPILPASSTNIPGITGTWSPATINTAAVATTTYSFTPDAGQCSLITKMNISILPKSSSTTTVSVCSLELPYTWNNQVINSAGTYQSALVGSNGCDSIATLNLAVNEAFTPTFSPIVSIIQGSVAPALSDTSSNGITGTWNPATISTAAAGTATYTFTPDPNQCAKATTMDVTILLDAVIAGPTLTGVCEGATLSASKSIGDIVKYEWSLLGQGGTLDSTTNINTTFKLSPGYTGSLPANFMVKLMVTSRNGFTSSDTITIKVEHPPVAEVHSSGSLEKDGSMIVDGSISTGTDLTYKWSTTQGKIMGADNQPTAKLFGAGIYTLQISDSHGCTDTKTFQYPLAFHSITANPDYARIAWDQDTTINVLANDHSTVYLRPGTVTVTDPASRGGTSVNPDGSITYVPQGKNTGSDTFIYQVCDTLDFCASAKVTIEIYDSGVKIPEGFSPNGDGENDNLVFPDLPINHPYSQLYVYTRSGQLVYQNLNYQNNWDGRMANHELVPTGTYYYVLKITVPYSRIIKSFIYIGY